MIWVTWRQHRASILIGTAIIVGLCAFLLVTGTHIWSDFRSSGAAACAAARTDTCAGTAGSFNDRYHGYQFLIPLFLLLPALVGIFWGAPLVARETEHGTHRLAWTQGVSRRRWLATKIVILTSITVVTVSLYTWLLAWWSRPFVAVASNRFDPGIFDLRGIVPIAYAVFALALGIAAGTFMRRSVPAMGITLVVYAFVRGFITLGVRRYFGAAKNLTYPFPLGKVPFSFTVGRDPWTLGSQTIDGTGHVLASGVRFDFDILSTRCPDLVPRGTFPDPDHLTTCVKRIGLRVHETYQPGSHYWSFQFIESAIFIGLAAVLLMFTVRWLRRRLS